ncbi:hypothetical protein ACLGI4_03265 [Streptomyces sp. HMX112]|uniref:hypothetical protein n=1 Tax=Streptomyces sp. HMX112 TaxID=3390850 RepID=UPI003A7F82D2
MWPRGPSERDARVDARPASVTPSTRLRRRHHGEDGTHQEFRLRRDWPGRPLRRRPRPWTGSAHWRPGEG